MATSIVSLEKQLKSRFPKLWLKPGQEFDPRYKNSLWTGEGSTIGDLQAFDSEAYAYDPEEKLFVMGVNKQLFDFLSAKGYYAEAYDGGTYFIQAI